MLPARRAPVRINESPLNLPLWIGAGLLFIYALAIGIGLLGGDIAPDNSYALMAPIPLILAACYGYGFLRGAAATAAVNANNDNGLLISALGWLAGALCLLTLQRAAGTALASGLRLDQMTPTPLSWFFALLCVAGIVAGGLLSLQHFQNQSV